MKPIVIIGSGLAGYTVAREFRKLDKTTPVVIVTADDGGFYSKPMLSNAFAQQKNAAQLVTQSATHMAGQLNAHIMTGTRVRQIDIARQAIETSAGLFDYDRLVIATGANPVRISVGGDAATQVLSVNHLDDYAELRARIAQCQHKARVAILGAGLIGCEFADDLSGAGYAVTLIDPNLRPLAALAAPALSRGLHAALSARGVALRLGTTAARVERTGSALLVTLADGNRVEADIVLSAVGLRPDLMLAQQARLTTGRGIVVDAAGQTSAPGVYALGDCAEYTGPDGGTRVLPYIAPLMSAARAIARSLAGQPTDMDWRPAPVIVKTPSYPMALLPPPPHATGGRWQTETAGHRTVCRFYGGDDVMAGFGVAPQDHGIRQELLASLGTVAV